MKVGHSRSKDATVKGGDMEAESQQEPDVAATAARVVHGVLPWIALAVLVWVLFGIWSGFQIAQKASSTGQANGASATASSTADATASVGTTGTVIGRQGTWMHVRDAARKEGWIPSSTRYVNVPTP
jgi:hypothetical protein